MPVYEYECGTCGNRFERRQSMSEAPVRECPACGKPVRRIIGSGASVHAGGRGRRGGCSFQDTGRTCCGRDSRCGKSSCETNR